MAKIRVVNYTFNAVGKTITFTDYGSILLDAIYAVVNSTTQQIIYNPSNTSLGGTVATNVLTLEGDTTGMNNTDKLLILYDDLSSGPLTLSGYQASAEINLSTNAILLPVTTTAAQTAANVAAGRYYISTDVDVFMKNHATANDVTTSAFHFFLNGGVLMGPFVFGGSTKLGGITATGSGTVKIMKVG